MTLALYRKWRPQTWDDVIGQDHVVDTLCNALKAERIVHAYLFAGPRGTGKTSAARLLAKTVNCLSEDPAQRPCGECEHCQALNEGRFLDLIEIDAASNTSVDDVRDLRDKINFLPNQGRYKVYIIDEVHMLSTAAFNALLKTLEEPPAHAIFVLATTEAHKIPATVTSRCQRHEFRRISIDEIIAQLKKMAQSEGIQASDESLELIARQATGSMRDAISLLDQLASTGKEITLGMAQDVLGTATSQSVLDLMDAVISKEAPAGLDQIHTTLDAGGDPRQFARQIVDYLRGLLLMNMGNKEQSKDTADVKLQMEKHADQLSVDKLLDLIRVFNHAAYEARASWQPALPLEMAFLEAIETTSAPVQIKEAPAQRAPERKTPAKAVKEAQNTQEPDIEVSPQDQEAMQSLNAAWGEIIKQVRRDNPKAYGLLNSTKSRYIKGNQVVLCFNSEIVKQLMEKEANIETFRQILVQVLQKDLTVRCEVDSTKRNTIPPELGDDGMVAAAVRDLGAEIVDIQ